MSTMILSLSGPLCDQFSDEILLAAKLVFESVRDSRLPKRIRIKVKRLRANRGDANPTGWTDCKGKVILRISSDSSKYPCWWYQSKHPEWPRVNMLNAAEAAFLTAAHEFAHIALHAEKMSTEARYEQYKNFEEWLCETIATNALLIRRGVITSSLC